MPDIDHEPNRIAQVMHEAFHEWIQANRPDLSEQILPLTLRDMLSRKDSDDA